MKIVLLIIWLYQACGFACHQSCLTCSGTTQLDCLTCSSGIVSPAGKCSCPPLQVFQEGICQVACSDGYEEQGLYCQKCQTNCRKCLNQVCLSCFNIHQKLNSNICQPYCEPLTYYFEQECIWLINQGEEKNFEILFYAFNEDKNSCEAESIQFTFEPILSSSGNNCAYFNGFLIFGNNYIWHSRKGSLFKTNLKDHSYIILFMKIFLADQWTIDDRVFITIDDIIVYDYNVTNNNQGLNLEQNIKLNISHTSNNLTLVINVQNQIETGYLGISDLQLIIQLNSDSQPLQNGQITCSNQQIILDNVCIDCNSLPNRLQNCNCFEGYYFNIEKNQCLICELNCLTCQYQESFCTSCKLNYQFPPHCDCSSIQLKGIASFSINIPQIQIKLESNFTIHSEKCENLFQKETYSLLGENPICFLEDKIIKIIFGSNFHFNINDLIQLNTQNIMLGYCDFQIFTVELQYIVVENIIPQLFLSTQELEITGMSNETIQYYATEQLNSIQWVIMDFKTDFNPISDLINKWNQLIYKQLYFEIEGKNFKQENQILLSLNFCNFLKICSSVKLKINILFNFEHYLHLSLLYQRNRRQDSTSLNLIIQAQIEVGGNLLEPNETLSIYYSFTGNLFQMENQVNLSRQSSYVISIDQSKLNLSEHYSLNVVGKIGELTKTKQFQIIQNEALFLVKIKGGNKIQSYKNPLILEVQINNEIPQLNSFQYIIWTCFNFQTNSECRNQCNQTLLFNQNVTTLTISHNTFEPYSILQFRLDATLNYKIYNDQITVQFVEEDLPILQITTNNKNIINNDYDNIEFTASYSDLEYDSDILDFKGMIISDFQILSYFKFNYTIFQIRLSDYYTLVEDQTLLYRFAINNPFFLIPSLYSIPIAFNSPPQKCDFHIIEINKFYLISIQNCIDSDIPLQYRFSIYLSEPKLKFYEIQTNNQIYLSDFTYNKTFITNLFGNQVIIGVEVKDIYNGISNFIYYYSLNQSNYQFYLPEVDSENIVYQISYYLQFQINQKILIANEQIQYFQQIQNTMDTQQINNIEIFEQNALIFELFQQQLSHSVMQQLPYLHASIKQLTQDVDQLINSRNNNQYFQQLKIDEKILYLLQYFSYLLQIQDNQLKGNSRRLLQNNEDANQILENIVEIANQQLKLQLPNGLSDIKYTSYFNITTTKFTYNYQKNSQININLPPNTYISQQIIKFKDNIFLNEMNIDNLQNGSFPLYNVQMQSSDSSNSIHELNGILLYEFDISEQENNYQCAIKTDAGWNLDECKATIQSYKVICECQKIGPTTIVQVFNNFQRNIVNLFTENNFNRIIECNYFKAVFTYFEIIFALFFLWFLYYGNQMDLNQKEDNEKTLSMQKIYPIQTKTLQNDVKSTYTRQSSLKNFNTLPHKIIPIIEANESLGGRDEEPPISSPEYRDKTIAIKINENGINSPKSSQLMGFTQEQILSTERSLNQHYLSNNIKLQTDKLTKFMMFYKNYHKILALYYRYDQRNSRPVRVTLLYLSILGQMSVVNWFGEVFDFQIVLILSLITYTFGLLFKRILAFFLMSNFVIFQYMGNLIATLFAIFFIFVTISTIPLYRSTSACNLWAFGFISGLITDIIVYTTIQILLMFMILQPLARQSVFQKIFKSLLDPVCYAIIFSQG